MSHTNGDGPSESKDLSENDPFPLTDRDRQLLATNDVDFTPISWSRLTHYIHTQQYEALQRIPSQMHLYLAWCSTINRRYGSVTNYVLQERIKWEPLPSSDPDAAPSFECKSDVPFAERDDYRVRPNDWPYGFEPGITHIVVWLKTRVPAEPDTGVITEDGARLIKEFVSRYFESSMREAGLLEWEEAGEERIQWFKNPIKLQSVRAVEHVQVMIRGATRELLEKWYDKI